MLENTGHTETKVPNTLALVAAKAVVEQAQKYQEQAREALERKRAEERARADNLLQVSREDAVKVSVEAAPAPAPVPTAAPSAPEAAPANQSSRGTAVDLNA